MITGFVLAGGKVMALFQPLEVLIICGASLGAMIIGNPLSVSIGVVKSAGAHLAPQQRLNFHQNE